MATDIYSPIRSGYICVRADAKGQCCTADTRQQRPEEAHQLPERWTHCRGVIWKAGEAETPARPLFLSISSRTSMRHLLGGELRLNCVLICIIVHINEARLYEYSYFLFCCLIKKRRGWKGLGVGCGGLESRQSQQQNGMTGLRRRELLAGRKDWDLYVRCPGRATRQGGRVVVVWFGLSLDSRSRHQSTTQEPLVSCCMLSASKCQLRKCFSVGWRRAAALHLWRCRFEQV